MKSLWQIKSMTTLKKTLSSFYVLSYEKMLSKWYFKYGGKMFWCRETSVADYCLYIRDPDYFFEKKLTEGGKSPELSKVQLAKFTEILLLQDDAKDKIDRIKRKPTERQKQRVKDIHIWVGILGKVTNLDVMSLPLSMFWDMLKDLDVINLTKEYKEDRHRKTANYKWVKDALSM